MAYDEDLAQRVRAVVASADDLSEKKMFGGLAFLTGGRMFAGIIGDDLMVRVGPVRYESALKERDARPMDFSGRPIKGYIYVGSGSTRDLPTLRRWMKEALAFASTLPVKETAPARKRGGRRR